MENKLEYQDAERRKNNLIFFGVNEAEQTGPLIEYLTKFIESETKIPIQPYEINNAHRLGTKGKETRPVIVSFTSTWKRNLIFKNKRNTSSDIRIKEDFSKEMLERRKELLPQLLQEREKGKIAYLQRDKLIVKDPKEDNNIKRKRDQAESLNISPNHPDSSAIRKVHRTNILNYVTRGRSTPRTETKN